jgi:perosamine synthetase
MIRLSKVSMSFSEYKSVFLTMRSGNLSQGKNVLNLESLFANFVQINPKNCVAVNSGTSGLFIALVALGVGKGDEVLLPSFSFAATANVVKLVGAEPIFCDIDPKTFNISINDMTKKITKKTKCIIPVHIFGLPSDLPEIYKVAKLKKLLVIEDAAQAHGAEINGKKVGWNADASVYSFYPTKNVTSVEGGMIIFRNQSLADFGRLYRNQGMRKRYEHEIVGMNLRMSDVHAAVGVVQMSRIAKFSEARLNNAEFYRENLAKVYSWQTVPVGFKHVYHQFCIRVGKNRNQIQEFLKDKGTETGVYYPTPIHKLKAFNEKISLFETEKLCNEILAIPVHSQLKRSELKSIVRQLNSIQFLVK